jgi:Putative zinc-finger
MDHNHAVESQAVERYLLGEMPPDERDLFEEHFFTCENCAEEVRAGASFRANSRSVLPEFDKLKHEAAGSWIWNWLRPPVLAGASALLAVVVVYQAAIKIPSLESQLRTQAVPAVALRAATRGDSVPHISSPTGLFMVYFDVPNTLAASYHCILTDSAGKAVDDFKAACKPNEPLNVLLDRRRLAPGRYTLKLQSDSGDGSPSAQYMFIVE